MKSLRGSFLWLAPLVLFTVNWQFDMAGAGETTAQKSPALPWNQIGAKAGADYHGDGLSVTATAAGARLHCVFQRLDADATDEGLWLASTVTNPPGDRFRVIAAAVDGQSLSPQGTVTVAGQTVRFTRPGLVEEYSVSMDGVRQDFVVTQKPAGDGELKVQLSVTGARVEQTAYGAQLVLEKSGRKLAYSRLHATDATGKELPARIVAEPDSAFRTPHSALVLVVKDAGAVYPIRIDPTFSDANWTALGSGMGGTYPGVDALAVMGGTLYAGGSFTTAGGTNISYIAQWNGTSWAPLGSGLGGEVSALAVSGTNLYAGGAFTMAGGNPANDVAEWNGSSWSPLGSGVGPIVMYSGFVNALAVSGTNLYVGGYFSMAGGNPANNIAVWNGSNWSPLGSGTYEPGGYGPTPGAVDALAISGTNLYVGGTFISAGGTNANLIAEWNGSSWSPLGSGMGGAGGPEVLALVPIGTNLFAGGYFAAAGGTNALNVAEWNGSSWSPVGSGVGNPDDFVWGLAASGTNLYAGGNFSFAGGNSADSIAQWNGSNWSPLGSGISGNAENGAGRPFIETMAVSGGLLYVGGNFTTAGGNASSCIAEATIGPPTILAEPQSTNVMAGGDADFTVGAEGQPLSYRWFKNGNGLSDGGNISGSASNLLLLTNVYVDDPGWYLMVVSNNFGSVTSSVATLTVSNLPLVFPGVQGNLGFTNNQFWLTVAGPAGSNVVVYASTNLQTWVPLATNPISLGSLTFTDLLATNYLNRFYRAQLSP